ncbi:hypothetical protein L1887_18557 [Cichorium endivia]|nr:hypothetical protein L1887_18557 [Cichorium endivia]
MGGIQTELYCQVRPTPTNTIENHLHRAYIRKWVKSFSSPFLSSSSSLHPDSFSELTVIVFDGGQSKRRLGFGHFG